MPESGWEKFTDSVRDFLTQYPLYAAVDAFLDSKWGKRLLTVAGLWLVSSIGAIVAFAERLGPVWKYGFSGAAVALLIVAVLMFVMSRQVETRTDQSRVGSDALAMSAAAIGVRMIPDPASTKVPYVQFETANRQERTIDTGGRPNKLRFITPVERMVVEDDLPATIKIGKGRLIVKRFADAGFSVEERNTSGQSIRVEVYSAPLGPRSWPSLSQRQVSELRNRFAKIPPAIEEWSFRNIQIMRTEFPDCADLADDIAEAFRDAWSNPTILPGKPWGDLKQGIWIVGPSADPRGPILLSILSEVLGPEYEPIGLTPWSGPLE